MTQTSHDFLQTSTPPWISIGAGESARTRWIPSHFYGRDDPEVCVRRLRGRKMRTTGDLMNEVGAALQFFDGFGENWHALQECLSYMDEWLPASAYVIVVEGAEDVLIDDHGSLGAMLTTFHAAGEFWSMPVTSPARFVRPPAPFHLLLNLTTIDAASCARFQAAAELVRVPLRLADIDERRGDRCR